MELLLFITIPSEIVDNVNALPLKIDPAVLPEMNEDVAGANEPLTSLATLVTNKVSPPLAKKLYAAIDVKYYEVTIVGTSTGPITVGPRIAALFLMGPWDTNELSFSVASTPGDINVSAMLMSCFLFCYKYIKDF